MTTLVRGVDRRYMRGFFAMLRLDSLDGTAEGDGETDDDANATCGRGAGIMVVVVFVRKALSTKNRGIR